MSATDVEKHVKVYITVFVALMILTTVTVGISYLDLSIPMGIVLGLFVAMLKGSLVLAYFMHFIAEKKLILYLFLLTMTLFVLMILLSSFSEGMRLETYYVP
jgi:cytochrome c oxidase subunit 4